MKTTAHSSAGYAVQLIGTLAVNAALLLVGVRLTGIAWQDLCFLLVPPMMAGAGAPFAILVLDRMALRKAVPAVANFSVPPALVKAAPSC
jgi:Na+/citrate or Na+/malate symporter